MKKPILLISLLFVGVLLCSSSVFAQSGDDAPLTKKEQKALKKAQKAEMKKWKKQAVNYKKNPEQLKSLIAAKDEAEAKSNKLQKEVSMLSKKVSDAENTEALMQAKIDRLENDLTNAERQIMDLNQREPVPVVDQFATGVVFKVQIGAYAKTILPDDVDSGDLLELENSEAMQKVILGQFRDYALAKELQERLQKMGVSDAWIVSYIDNTRVPVEEAFQALQGS